jgi:hypothetical protein
MKLDLAIPDYTSLCKRAKKFDIAISIRKTKGQIDIVVDSTGLKAFGKGEWKVKKHGWAKQSDVAKIAFGDRRGHTGDRGRGTDGQQRA